jgi:hypothetical protein
MITYSMDLNHCLCGYRLYRRGMHVKISTTGGVHMYLDLNVMYRCSVRMSVGFPLFLSLSLSACMQSVCVSVCECECVCVCVCVPDA